MILLMQRINSRFVHSNTETIRDEAVTMPLVFCPSRSHHIRSGELAYLRSHKLAINEQLHFNAPPRISIINHPTRDTTRFNNRFAPTMKRRWKQLYIDDNRKSPDKDRLED